RCRWSPLSAPHAHHFPPTPLISMAAPNMKPARKSSTAKIDTPSPGDKGKPLNATRLLIIDTAERLFAAHGISGVSLRQIIAEADVNLASIHYYFGTKNALFDAVFERRAKAITAERSRRLTEFRSRPTPPELED